MPNQAASQKLADHLDEAIAKKGNSSVVDSAEEGVNSLLNTWPRNQGVYAQLQRLAEFIDQTKMEIAQLRPSEVKGEFIPSATDELDAIVEATASATNKIMDSAEVLLDLTSKLSDEDSAQGMDAVTQIYEACTFQDITGQRITKVVSLLKVIEDRVSAMSGDSPREVRADLNTAPEPEQSDGGSSFSQDDIDSLFGNSDSSADVADEDLLNGPALPGKGTSQDEIDALFDN